MAGVSQCGGIGVGSGKYTNKGVVVEMEQHAANDSADEQRYDGYEGSYPYPSQTFGGKYGADEVAPDTKSNAGQKDADAELTDHEVRGDCVVGDELVFGAEVANEDGDDERAARESKFQGMTHAWQPEWHIGKQTSEGDAKEDGNEVGYVEPLHLVTQPFLRMTDGQFGAYNGYAVAHLQAQMRSGHKFHARAIDVGDVGAELGADVQLSDGLAIDFRLGDQDAA